MPDINLSGGPAVMNGVDEVAVKLVKVDFNTRPVVLLLLLLGQADSPSRKELELFLKEVQTLAKLHHRNIVQFYGACLETGSMFFVTELMKVSNNAQ
jgi:serine/threonine protein kinase